MSKISLPDFFKYFDPHNVNQLEAIVLLESMMPDSLLQDEPKPSSWVVKYREKPKVPPSVVPPQCLDIIAEFEGFRSSPYLCPAGVPTIGYGCTFYPDGKKGFNFQTRRSLRPKGKSCSAPWLKRTSGASLPTPSLIGTR